MSTTPSGGREGVTPVVDGVDSRHQAGGSHQSVGVRCQAQVAVGLGPEEPLDSLWNECTRKALRSDRVARTGTSAPIGRRSSVLETRAQRVFGRSDGRDCRGGRCCTSRPCRQPTWTSHGQTPSGWCVDRDRSRGDELGFWEDLVTGEIAMPFRQLWPPSGDGGVGREGRSEMREGRRERLVSR